MNSIIALLALFLSIISLYFSVKSNKKATLLKSREKRNELIVEIGVLWEKRRQLLYLLKQIHEGMNKISDSVAEQVRQQIKHIENEVEFPLEKIDEMANLPDNISDTDFESLRTDIIRIRQTAVLQLKFSSEIVSLVRCIKFCVSGLAG